MYRALSTHTSFREFNLTNTSIRTSTGHRDVGAGVANRNAAVDLPLGRIHLSLDSVRNAGYDEKQPRDADVGLQHEDMFPMAGPDDL
ncbi:hypothetical protein FA95DRAFT_1681606 [Auriscalpium vulgare]|uniref:Uncharacterized protein n=1 Tax=Auriscalpium vulgare TaxID=40419 RepID=A0ACB8RIH5_9AGAM|nr:hypothetical protein FA95DRAFT_1681606 [Auriscalpium vulgare]